MGEVSALKEGLYVFFTVCYVPPVDASRDVLVAERFLLLEEQTHRFQAEGQVVLCSDFITKCGGLRDLDDEGVDMVKIEQGEMLVECMKSMSLSFVKSRQDPMTLPVSPVKGDLWLITAWFHVKS